MNIVRTDFNELHTGSMGTLDKCLIGEKVICTEENMYVDGVVVSQRPSLFEGEIFSMIDVDGNSFRHIP